MIGMQDIGTLCRFRAISRRLTWNLSPRPYPKLRNKFLNIPARLTFCSSARDVGSLAATNRGHGNNARVRMWMWRVYGLSNHFCFFSNIVSVYCCSPFSNYFTLFLLPGGESLTRLVKMKSLKPFSPEDKPPTLIYRFYISFRFIDS